MYRIQDIQLKVNKMVENLVPSVEARIASPRHHPMTFKDAALTVASRLRTQGSPRCKRDTITADQVESQEQGNDGIDGADVTVEITSASSHSFEETSV